MPTLEDKQREHLLSGFLDKCEMAYVIPTWYSPILAVKFSGTVKNEAFNFFLLFLSLEKLEGVSTDENQKVKKYRIPPGTEINLKTLSCRLSALNILLAKYSNRYSPHKVDSLKKANSSNQPSIYQH